MVERMARLKPDRHVVIGERALLFPQHRECAAAVGVEGGLVRRKPDRFVEVFERAFEVLGHQADEAAALVAVGILRLQADRFGIVGIGAGPVLLVAAGIAAIEQRADVCFAAEPLVIVGDGAILVALLVIDDAAQAVDLRNIRPQLDHGAVVGDGAVIVLELRGGRGAHEIDQRQFRVDFHRAVGIGQRAFGLACDVE